MNGTVNVTVNPTDNVRYACHASHDMRFFRRQLMSLVQKVVTQT